MVTLQYLANPGVGDDLPEGCGVFTISEGVNVTRASVLSFSVTISLWLSNRFAAPSARAATARGKSQPLRTRKP